MRLHLAFTFLAVALSCHALTTIAADAGDTCPCNAILIQNVDRTKSQSATDLAILRVMTEESFNEIKKGGGGGGGVNYAGIYEIQGSANWNEFQAKRDARFKSDGYNKTSEEARGELHQYLSPAQVTAWSNCMESCLAWKRDEAKKNSAPPRKSFECFVEQADAFEVTVFFRLDSPAGVPRPGLVKTSQLFGAKAYEKGVHPGEAFVQGFEIHDEIPVRRTYRRIPGESFRVTVDVRNDSASAYLPPLSPENQKPNRVISGVKQIPFIIQVGASPPANSYAASTNLTEEKYFISISDLPKDTLPKGATIVEAWWSPFTDLKALQEFTLINVARAFDTTICLSLRALPQQTGSGASSTIMIYLLYWLPQ